MFRGTVFQESEIELSNERHVTMSKYRYAQPREGRLRKILLMNIMGGPTMSDQMVGLCWTALSSRLGLISSTFALYQISELELFQVLQEYPHAN